MEPTTETAQPTVDTPTREPGCYFGPSAAHLGRLFLSQRVRYTFHRVAAGPKLLSVNVHCGCTIADHTDNTVTVEYTAPGSLPEYYQERGETEFRDEKYVTLQYGDTAETLTINATITSVW